MKNAERITPAVAELNEEMLDKVNGGCLLTAAAVGTVITFGTGIVAAYVYKIVRLCQLRKVWTEEKRQRREQKAAAEAAVA